MQLESLGSTIQPPIISVFEIEDTSAQLRFTNLQSGQFVKWQLSNYPTFSNIIKTGYGRGTIAKVTGLKKGVKYYVRGLTAVGLRESGFGPMATFTAGESQSAVTPGVKTTGATLVNNPPPSSTVATNATVLPVTRLLSVRPFSTSIMISWTRPSSVSLVRIQVAEDVNFTNNLRTVKSGGTSLSMGLKENTVYFVRVQSYKTDQITSSWSTTKVKTLTAPKTPEFTISNVTTEALTISWSNPNQDKFQYYVRQSSPFKSIKIDTTTGNSVRVSGLTPGVDHDVLLRVIESGKVTGFTNKKVRTQTAPRPSTVVRTTDPQPNQRTLTTPEPQKVTTTESKSSNMTINKNLLLKPQTSITTTVSKKPDYKLVSVKDKDFSKDADPALKSNSEGAERFNKTISDKYPYGIAPGPANQGKTIEEQREISKKIIEGKEKILATKVPKLDPEKYSEPAKKATNTAGKVAATLAIVGTVVSALR